MSTFKLCTGLLLGLTCLQLSAGGLSKLGNSKAEKVAASFYFGKERTPSLVIRANRIYTDYERKGFYRIGLLPLQVLEDVTIEVRRSDFVIGNSDQLTKWFTTRAATRTEIRNFTILTGTEEQTRLTSSLARITSQGDCDLFGLVRLHSGTNITTASHATLKLGGPQIGELILLTSTPRTNQLFGCFSSGL